MVQTLRPGRVARIRKRALGWYARGKRDLPWRTRADPYRVWVSEVMLQQTRVETVIPYYLAFTRRFPTLPSLARAAVDDVLSVWSGLGYYRRARNLHRAATEVMDRHGGEVPRSRGDLRSLPGVGEYTAGAIRSIAFGERAAAVDGNVIRVISRLQGFRRDPGRGGGPRIIREWAETLVPSRDPGAFNQALMELGATICLPRNPSCPDCPVRGSCRARKLGIARRIPPVIRERTRAVREVSAWIRRRGKILLARRPEGGLLGGLWELPGGEPRASEEGGEALRRIVMDGVGLEVQVGRPVGGVRHAITDRQIRGTAYECRPGPGRCRARGYEACRWLPPEESPRLPLTGVTRKYLSILLPRDRGRPALTGPTLSLTI